MSEIDTGCLLADAGRNLASAVAPLHRWLLVSAVLTVMFALTLAGRESAMAAFGARKWEPYVIGDGARFAINTNRTWRVVEDDRKPAIEKGDFSPSLSSKDPARRIWSRKCLAGRQVLHFTRTVKLLGVPTAQRKPSVNVTFSTSGALSSVEIRVNERRLLFTRTLSSTTVSRRGIFEPGLNDIEITVVKPPGACASAPPSIGMSLYGDFETDLLAVSLGHNPVQTTEHKVITIPFVVGTRGPSPLPFADIGINLNAGSCTLKNPDGTCFTYQFQWVGVGNLDADGPDPKCKITAPGEYAEFFKSTSGYSAIYCRFDNLRPGAPISLKLSMFFTVEDRSQVPNYDYESASFWWQARNPDGPREAAYGDEAGNSSMLFCDVPSSNASCLEAFPPG